MLKNYLVVALRNLLKYKSYSIINISGLAIGIAGCLLIFLWVQDELSYDRFHEKADRIVRVVQSENVVTPAVIAPFLQRTLPDVELGVRFYNATRFGPYVIRVGDQLFQEKRFWYADSTAFAVFSLPFLAGHPQTALTRPRTVVVTASMAQKYFGREDPIGQTIKVNNRSEFEVTGVIRDLPNNSHLQFDFLASYVTLGSSWARNETSWDSANLLTYFLVADATVIPSLNERIQRMIEEEFGAQLRGSGNEAALTVQPLTDIHLHSKLLGEQNGDILYLYGFSAIALGLLLIACINYMNLATARSARRAREVGMRKVLGAVRGQISRQFFGESAVVTIFALGLAVVVIQFFLPTFNSLSGKSLTVDLLGDPFILASLGLIGVVVSIVAGIYPALLLSSFRPVQALKKNSSKRGSEAAFRNKLVILQFSVSMALIVATLVVKNQLDFVRSRNLGFEKEQVLVLPIGDTTLQQNYHTLKAELKTHANIHAVAASDGYPGNQLGGYLVGAEGLLREDYPAAGGMIVDRHVVETLGLSLIAGRGFPTSYTAEQGYMYVINETLLGKLGWAAEESVGKELNLHGRRGPIVGVSKDFHFMSLHNPIHPLAMFTSPNPQDYEYLLVKFRSQDVRGVLQFIEATWKDLAAHRPFEYTFLDEEFDALYRAEEQVGEIFFGFSALAIVIACLGLFGLASFTAEQRTKEIGIRKVLGASAPEILVLLCGGFARLIGLAFLAAAPVAYFGMNAWLQDFAYRVNIGVETFATGGGLVLVIALLVVSYQSIRAALSKPIEALRYE